MYAMLLVNLGITELSKRSVIPVISVMKLIPVTYYYACDVSDGGNTEQCPLLR